MKKKSKVLIIMLSVILIVIFMGGMVYLNTYYKADTLAKGILKSDEVSIVNNIIEIHPKISSDIGFIFYPGGKVEEEAYLPLMKKIADEGYNVYIVPMTFRLAILSGDKGQKVIDANPKIKTWAIGGHSLGGVMAADFAYKHSNEIKGLALYASYPLEKNNLSSSNIKVVSIWGSEDKVADRLKIESGRSILPMNAVFFEIKGGNHGGFGNYGHQKGDGDATISSEEEQSQAAKITAEMLRSIK